MVGLTELLNEQSVDDPRQWHAQAGQCTLAALEAPRLAGRADPAEPLITGNELTSPLGPAVPARLPYQAAPDPTQEAPQSQVLITGLTHSRHPRYPGWTATVENEACRLHCNLSFDGLRMAGVQHMLPLPSCTSEGGLRLFCRAALGHCHLGH